jgi:hypothetical protein
MRWIPPWLAKAYAIIYAEKGTQEFEFAEAARLLQINAERTLAKTLFKLKVSGYLAVRRDPTEPRRKLFKLIDPQSLIMALAIQSKARSAELLAKLRAATGVLDYCLTGSFAAYQYHRYTAPGAVDLAIRPEQLPVWMALLAEREIALSTEEAPAEKPATVQVRLHTDAELGVALQRAQTRLIEGVRYLAPEALVVRALTEESPTLEDALAILVVGRKTVDWKVLLASAESTGVARFLGCMLEVLNAESGRRLFSAGRIASIRQKSKLEARLDFPRSMKAQPMEERYAEVASRWNLRVHLGRAIVAKIVTDLVRA